MNRFLRVVLCLGACLPAEAASIGTAANAVIPAEVQQIIAIDYRQLNNSPTALALKTRVLPEPLKQLESALRSAGISPDREVEQLTFASFRTPKEGLRIVGIAQGQFSAQKVRLRMKKKKVAAQRYRGAALYAMGNGMSMTLLDDYTMLFGEPSAVKAALETRDGERPSLNSNSQVREMIADVESGAVWSVLDAAGTQNMMKSVLGEAARLADFGVIKDRFLGSRYTMDFTRGVDFDLNVLTSDNFTAATLSSLLKATMLYKKMNGSEPERAALEDVTVDSDNGSLKLHFKSDDARFQALLQTDLFAAVSR